MSDVAEEPKKPVADVPQSQADWKARIASTPGKDLLKLVQRDKPRAHRVLSGFRATEQGIKNPVVVTRVVEEAMKQPGFASELAATLPPAALVPPPPPPSPFTPEVISLLENVSERLSTIDPDFPPFPTLIKNKEAEPKRDPKLREQIEKQRAALKEKEARIAELERESAQAKRDLVTVRADLDTARRAKDGAEAEAANLRRRAERDDKRVKTPEPAPVAKPVIATAPNTQHPILNTATPLEESLRRLVRRGKYATVAEVCREAIASGSVKEAPALVRGAVYALYAAALYGIGEPDRAADQDNRAAEAYLDAGAVGEATDAFTRLLNQPTLLRSTLADDATLLRRLVALAERDNKIAFITTAFARVRIVSPQGFHLLLSSLTRKLGKRGAEIAASLTQLAKDQSGTGGIGADETVTLPGTALPPLSPRKLADAVETGEHRFVLRVRDVLAQMRATGDPKQVGMVDSLLAAVGELSRIAVLPYTTAPGFAPRCAVVDASNIARHNPDPLALDSSPRVASLLTMREFLFRRGFFPVLLIADATLRFHVDDKAAYLALVEKQIVRETAPNTSADETLIQEARERDATLVTNDRLSDWGETARRVERFGFTLTQTGVALLPQ